MNDEKSTPVMHSKRFEDEFTGEELHFPKKNPKPEDYQQLFTGNTDDNFRIGISIVGKTLKVKKYIILIPFLRQTYTELRGTCLPPPNVNTTKPNQYILLFFFS